MQSIPKLQSTGAANSLSVRLNLEQLMCLKSDNFDVANSWMSLTELKNLRKLRLLNVEISEEEQVGEEEWTTLQMPESLQIRESRLYAAASSELEYSNFRTGCQVRTYKSHRGSRVPTKEEVAEGYLDARAGDDASIDSKQRMTKQERTTRVG
ncbi:hypothetical protein ACLOJK_035978 [Asimina triloba]